MHISRPCQIQILKTRSFGIYEDVIKADPKLCLTRPRGYIPEIDGTIRKQNMDHYKNQYEEHSHSVVYNDLWNEISRSLRKTKFERTVLVFLKKLEN